MDDFKTHGGSIANIFESLSLSLSPATVTVTVFMVSGHGSWSPGFHGLLFLVTAFTAFNKNRNQLTITNMLMVTVTVIVTFTYTVCSEY